jgi:hypothetical protein
VAGLRAVGFGMQQQNSAFNQPDYVASPPISSIKALCIHDWWFTAILQLWLGYLLWRITYWEAHKDEYQRRQQAQGKKLQKIEVVRQKKEMKVQQRRQMKKKGR